MKPLLTAMATALAVVLGIFLLPASPQGSMSLPWRVPVYCSGVANTCVYPYVPPNSTGVIVCRQCAAGAPTDGLGDVWTQDQCTPYDNGDCIYSTRFNVPYLTGDKITFPAGEGLEVYLLIYSGVWTFDQGNYGTYAAQNSVFADCTNGQDCPYQWTLPVELDPGELMIELDNSNATGAGIAVPGFGFNIEGNSGHFAIADMIAPVEGVYIGSLSWNNLDGSPGGGSHWVMGLAAYQQATAAGSTSAVKQKEKR